MFRRTLSAITALLFAVACTSQPAVVERTGPNDLLKLRAGPGLGYRVIMGLPDGTALNRRGCVTEVGQLWCEVSLASSPDVTGYVSADYISGI